MWVPSLPPERSAPLPPSLPVKQDRTPLFITLFAFLSFLVGGILLARSAPLVTTRFHTFAGCLLIVSSIAVLVGGLRWIFDTDPYKH